MSDCNLPEACTDACEIYDLCKVTVKGGECTPNGVTQVICEGFKFTAKMDVEVKTNSACYEGYGYQMSNIQYDWEITNPCDRDWFDKRFIAQICDRDSLEITGYVRNGCGDWIPKETLTHCIIEETGRDYGKGITRTLRGKALHRTIHSSKVENDGGIHNESEKYVDKRDTDVQWWEEGGAFEKWFDDGVDYAKQQFLRGHGGIGIVNQLYHATTGEWLL